MSAREARRRLELQLVHGNMVNVSSPVYVLSIFDNVNPTGAARAVDGVLGGKLSTLIQGQMFGSRLGEISLLPTPRQPIMTDLIAFAGLGPIDSFKPQLLEVVYENITRMLISAKLQAFATVTVGANTGQKPEVCLRHMITGFLRGIEQSEPDHDFYSIQVCEMDEARHHALARHLEALAAADELGDHGFELKLRHVTVARDAPVVRSAPAASRPTLDMTFLSVRHDGAHLGNALYEFTVLTTGSGASIRQRHATIDVVNEKRTQQLLKRSKAFDREVGNSLVGEYIPDPELRREIVDSLKRSPLGYLVVAHDRLSANMPWEVMYFDDFCPAIDAGISRKLQIRAPVTTRANLPSRTKLRMLVVYDPTEDLDGAEDEGQMLAKLFQQHHGEVTTLVKRAATCAAVRSELESGDYHILHYAGHADFDETRPENSGLLCSDGRLVATDFKKFASPPQLIVLNGCESARLRTRRKGDAVPEEEGSLPPTIRLLEDQIDARATLAEKLIVNGVTNLVGTYWPVDDRAAYKFAETFHVNLLTGEPIGMALRKARQEVRRKSARDWANYLHFGDPEYTLRRK